MGISTWGILRSRSSSRKTMSRLKNLLGLTIARLAILKNQRKVRCNHARSDLLQLLQLAQQERALLRAELVIREQNMLDVFGMIEGYCHLLKERSVLLEQQRECPYELKEAVSSLVFASSRLGELPELQHARYIFTSMFGKEFVNAAIEIRNGCGINPKMVQKLSTKQPSLESRVRVTKEIAVEKGITLDLVYDEPNRPGVPDANAKVDPAWNHNKTDSSVRATYKYKDAVSAAQAAYESAEDAVIAAKAAVELSRPTQPSRSSSYDPNHGKSKDRPRKESEKENLDNLMVYPVQDSTSESEEEDNVEYVSKLHLYSDKDRDDRRKTGMEELRRSSYVFSSGFTDAPLHKEEDTFELASLKNGRQDAQFDEKSESDAEKRRLQAFDAASDVGLSRNQKRNSVRKTRENLNSSSDLQGDEMGSQGSAKSDDLSASYSSETTSFESEIGHKDSANILPKGPRKVVSMRTRR